MKTIGLIGGMSWESSAEYYRLINVAMKERLGGFHSARSLMHSVDLAEVAELQRAGDWGEAGELLAEVARSLERGGADFIVLCTNTMHEVAEVIEEAVGIPLLHIADATARRIDQAGIRRVGLLGTRYTMERDFYRGRLAARGLDVLVPDEPDRTLVHDVIYNELVLGRIEQDSRDRYIAVVDRLRNRGAEGVIFGCTEIGLLVTEDDVSLPAFDTTRLHAEYAVDVALSAG